MRSFLLQTLDWTKTNQKAVHRWRARTTSTDWCMAMVDWLDGTRKPALNMKTHENAKQKKTEWTSVGECHMKIYTTAIQPQS